MRYIAFIQLKDKDGIAIDTRGVSSDRASRITHARIGISRTTDRQRILCCYESEALAEFDAIAGGGFVVRVTARMASAYDAPVSALKALDRALRLMRHADRPEELANGCGYAYGYLDSLIDNDEGDRITAETAAALRSYIGTVQASNADRICSAIERSARKSSGKVAGW